MQDFASEITPYLLGLLVGLVAWIGQRLWAKLDRLEGRLADHNASTGERLGSIVATVEGIDRRVEHLENITLRRA